MLKFTKMQKIILAAIFMFGFNATSEIPAAQATYRSHSDTNTTMFDYIENRRRIRRAKALTDEQKQLQKDIEEAKQRLPEKIDPNDPAPVAFEGDDLTYNTLTGEFTAKGNVDIIQIDGHRFQTPEAKGNLKTHDVYIEGKSKIMQLTKDAPRVTLEGYNAVYNYGTKEGTMEKAKGKYGEYYISGKRFEFYPDHIIAYDAYQTKCGAKHPDYRVEAKRMEIWPEQIIRMYDAKFLMGTVVVGSRKYMERTFEEGEKPYFPKVGRDSKRGWYIEDSFEFPIFNEHFVAILNAHMNTKQGIRSNGEFHYTNRHFTAMALYGYYYDGDGRWIKKEPGLDLIYRKHFDHLPMTYKFEYEIGSWRSRNTASTHQEIEAGLTRDPIHLGKNFRLFLATSYKITKDDIKNRRQNKKTVKGWNYSARVLKEFDDRFAAYAGFAYTKKTSQNSLYDYDTDSYSHKFSTGLSYKLTEKDRFVVGWKFDTTNGHLKDTDCYWYRDLHCSTLIFRWRAKRDEWDIRWQFTPW